MEISPDHMCGHKQNPDLLGMCKVKSDATSTDMTMGACQSLCTEAKDDVGRNLCSGYSYGGGQECYIIRTEHGCAHIGDHISGIVAETGDDIVTGSKMGYNCMKKIAGNIKVYLGICSSLERYIV